MVVGHELVAVGLSPTMLYFNTLQTSYGVDLQMIPILLLLIYSMAANPVREDKARGDAAKTATFWFITMVACLSYPVFVLYLPSLYSL